MGDGERDLGPWPAWPVVAVADEALRLAGVGRQGSDRAGPLVVAVDGRGAGGKSHRSGVLAADRPWGRADLVCVRDARGARRPARAAPGPGTLLVSAVTPPR